jgi:hypothetical protein
MTRLVLICSMLWVGVAIGADLPTTMGKWPDPEKTPGLADPALTAEVICAHAWTTRDVRSVSAALKRKVYALYGEQNHKGRFAHCKQGAEVDHLVSLELGGANDIKNLWPQNYCGPWNAHIKDRLENKLHRLVCSGQITLGEAQKEIATDWIAAYSKYIGAEDGRRKVGHRR